MSQYEQGKQTIYDQTLDILRKAHDTYERKATDLRELGTEKLLEFFFQNTEENADLPYQYQRKTQMEFVKPALRIEDATGYIIQTLSKLQSNLWASSKTNQTIETLESEQQSIQQQRATMLRPAQVAEDIKNKTGRIEKLMGIFKRREPQQFDTTDPYHFLMQIYRDGIGVINNFKLVREYQTYAVRVLPTFMDIEGFEEYKKFHISKFEFEVEPDLMRIFREHIVMTLDKEKTLAMQVLTAHQRESFQTRQDFMLGTQPQNA